MNVHEVFERLQEKFGNEGVSLAAPAVGDAAVVVAPGRLLEVCRFLKSAPGLEFDYLRCVSGVDLKDRMESVYHLHSISAGHGLVLKVVLDRADPQVDSVEPVWKSANWFERESFDLLGIRYLGHPNLERIMMPRDWVGHPLRKDYVEQESYHGIPTSRPDPVGGKDA
jgi:NADH-quinone oxidoreductase subunit C